MDLLVKGTAHTRMKVIGEKTTIKTSATSDIGRLTKSLKKMTATSSLSPSLSPSLPPPSLGSFLSASVAMHFRYVGGIVG